MDVRHGRSTLTAPHPAHIAHDNTLSPTLIPALRLSYHIPPTEYAGLTSPALESGEWHMRLPAVALAKDGPACASRARLEVYAPVARRAPDYSYMVSDERNVERKSYRVASITAGDYNDDSRYAEWQQVNGNVTPTRPALMAYKSELFNAYQVTLDADRASSAATNHALQLAASDLEYEGTRVKSPVLGRDLNPMGRGDGAYYADGGNVMGGSVRVGTAKPVLIGEIGFGFGSSMNNQGGLGGGGDSKRTELMLKARDDCGVYITTCPTLEAECGDPCAGINIHDPNEFCCKCVPKLCPDCSQGGCSKKVGCCFTYTSIWHERCGNPGCCGAPPILPVNAGNGTQETALCNLCSERSIPYVSTPGLWQITPWITGVGWLSAMGMDGSAMMSIWKNDDWIKPMLPYLTCVLEKILQGKSAEQAFIECAIGKTGGWIAAQTAETIGLTIWANANDCCCDANNTCPTCCELRYYMALVLCGVNASIGGIIKRAFSLFGYGLCVWKAKEDLYKCLLHCQDDCEGNV